MPEQRVLYRSAAELLGTFCLVLAAAGSVMADGLVTRG